MCFGKIASCLSTISRKNWNPQNNSSVKKRPWITISKVKSIKRENKNVYIAY